MSVSKPTLYTFVLSIWGAAPEIALAELGYSQDAVEQKQLVLTEGANFQPSFLRLNPAGTLPTLVVDGKSYTSTKDVVQYLIKHAPNATKELSGSDEFIDLIHEAKYDPNFVLVASRNDAELKQQTEFSIMWFTNRLKAIAEGEKETREFDDLYKKKRAGEVPVLELFNGAASDEFRKQFYELSTAHWNNINSFIDSELPKYLPESGFIHGERPGEGDFHLAAWLARIVHILGGADTVEGVEALEKSLGHPPSNRLKAYWSAWVTRESWKVVYATAPH